MVDRRQMKSAGRGRHGEGGDGLHKLPVLLVSTSADDESIACQQIVDVDANGVFETDVAVSNDFSSWSVLLTACQSTNGDGPCRLIHVDPPGGHSSDSCHPVAIRAVPTGQRHPAQSVPTEGHPIGGVPTQHHPRLPGCSN